MGHELRIISYFSFPTDLAGEMRGWPEYISGEGYTVDLKDRSTTEEVTVRFIENSGGVPYVRVSSSFDGCLFDRVVGRAVVALSAHSDNLMIDRRVE